MEQFAAGCVDPREVRGRCLDATLQLGREALRLGMAQRVEFVRWHVRNDPDFLEHWALVLDGDRVIDPTGAQVDGDSRAVRRMSEYPANYVSPRRYPVEGLVPVLGADEPAHGWRFSRRQIWSLHRWLFKHDARLAIGQRSLRDMADACGAVVRTAFMLLLDACLERTVHRLTKLMARRGA